MEDSVQQRNDHQRQVIPMVSSSQVLLSQHWRGVDLWPAHNTTRQKVRAVSPHIGKQRGLNILNKLLFIRTVNLPIHTYASVAWSDTWKSNTRKFQIPRRSFLLYTLHDKPAIEKSPKDWVTRPEVTVCK